MTLSPIERLALRARFGAEQAARVGWYAANNAAAVRRARELAKDLPPLPRPTISAPAGVPERSKLLPHVRRLLEDDLANVEAGLYPMPEDEGFQLPELLRRRALYMKDLPEVVRRRHTKASQEVDRTDGRRPRYYLQNFHYQSGGWMTPESAALYDTQVETLFFGAAAAMRRQGLVPIAEEVRGRDQRTMRLLDVACGTGAFLKDVTRAFPRLPSVALDLSEPYVRQARAALGDRPAVRPLVGNAEALPVADGSVDVLTSVYLFHELPPKVRPVVAREMGRVVRPGGIAVIVDSLQTGDTPEFDGLLELFPQMFHEPYYESYTRTDMAALFAEGGLVEERSWPAFMSKVFVFRKAAGRRGRKG